MVLVVIRVTSDGVLGILLILLMIGIVGYSYN